jgi:integrase/recombinase XerD
VVFVVFGLKHKEKVMPNSPWHVRQRDERDAVIPVLTAAQDFLASTEVKRLQPGTQDEYRRVLTAFGEWCAAHAIVQNRNHRTWKAVKVTSEHGPILLHQVNDQVVHCFLQHVEETHTPAKATKEKVASWTLANYAKGIKRFLNWCLLDEQYCHHVQAIVVQRIKKPKVEEVVLDTFSEQQIEALFRVCDQEESEHLQMRDRAILSLLLDSGIRATELCTLTIGNVDLSTSDPHIRVLGKGRKWGEVGIGEQARRAIQKYIRQFREPTIEHHHAARLGKLPAREVSQVKRQLMQQERVFVNRAGKPLTKSGLYQLIERLGDWAGIEGVRCSPHTLRHTFSVMFMRNGGDIYKLSKLLRHTSVAVTENYLRSLKQAEARKGAKSVLDNLR